MLPAAIPPRLSGNPRGRIFVPVDNSIQKSAADRKRLAALLESHGIHPTGQRVRIAELLLAREQHLTAEQVITLRHGQSVLSGAVPRPEVGRRVRVYGPGGEFLGLAEALADGWLQPRRLIQKSAS